MKKEFIPYEQALALKELGFDEKCLAFWDGKNTDAFYFNVTRDASGDYTPFQKHDRLKWFGAPLYQQAFRWFRENTDYIGFIEPSIKEGYYDWVVVNDDDRLHECEEAYQSYEAAELDCLKKLIEIVKHGT